MSANAIRPNTTSGIKHPLKASHSLPQVRSNGEDSPSYEELINVVKTLTNKSEQFIFACKNGKDLISLKLLNYLYYKKMEVLDALNNEEYRMLFKEFCQYELSTENIYFWEECLKYEEWISKEQRLTHAKQLYNIFIDPTSNNSLNIDIHAIKAIKKRIDDCENNSASQDDLSDLLDLVKSLVELCMSDTFHRFYNDKTYQNKISSFNTIDLNRIIDRKSKNATLMHLCAKYDKAHCIEFLFSKGMDLDSLDSLKATPLNYAISGSCDSAALFLIRNGAFISLKTENNPFPLTPTLRNKFYKITELLFEDNSDSAFKFEEEYIILKEITNEALAKLLEMDKKIIETITFDIVGNTIPNSHVFSLYIVEEKKSLKRYNVLCVTFRLAIHAAQYRNNYWMKRKTFTQENLLPIENIYLQKNELKQYQVYIFKVSGIFTLLLSLNII
jgi:hypothetical protein